VPGNPPEELSARERALFRLAGFSAAIAKAHPTIRAGEDALFTAKADQFPDNQEISGKPQLRDEIQLFFYLLPDGRLTLPWTRPLAALWSGFTLIWGFFPALPLNLSRPFQLLPSWFGVYLVWLLTGVLAQFHRYRRLSSRTQRQQTKSVVLCLVMAIVAYAVAYALGRLLQRQPQPNFFSVLYDLLHMPLMLVLILPIPLAITISIYRYQLFDMQFVLNRALVYSVLMALLTVVFFSGELALQLLFPMLLGDSLVIIVGAAVITTLTLHPLKHRVQRFVDRRFFRHKYDAAQLVAAFSLAARDEIDLARLAAQLEGVIAEALHPIHVLTWLATPGGYALYLDTRDPTIWPMAEVPASDPLVVYWLSTPAVMEVERLALDPTLANSLAVQMLHAIHVQLVAPLLAQECLVGWLGLGRRTSGQAYSHDDLQLLNTLAAQVTPALRLAQMVAAQQAAIVAQTAAILCQ
jgi:GAF domain-containing protein